MSISRPFSSPPNHWGARQRSLKYSSVWSHFWERIFPFYSNFFQRAYQRNYLSLTINHWWRECRPTPHSCTHTFELPACVLVLGVNNTSDVLPPSSIVTPHRWGLNLLLSTTSLGDLHCYKTEITKITCIRRVMGVEFSIAKRSPGSLNYRHMHTYTYTCIDIYSNTYIHIHVYILICIWTYTYICMYICLHMHILVYAYFYIYVGIYK